MIKFLAKHNKYTCTVGELEKRKKVMKIARKLWKKHIISNDMYDNFQEYMLG